MGSTTEPQAQWSSKLAFLLTAVGSSVGLGNLWRFSAHAGENGGGAFILVYIACILLVGIPVLICEYLIGRAGSGNSAVSSVDDLARQSNKPTLWRGLAGLGTLSAFLILSFYAVVAAWVILYIPKFFSGEFTALPAEDISAIFDTTLSSPWAVAVCTTGFFVAAMAFVIRGVNRGIELASKLLMPCFFILLAGLAAFGLWTGATATPGSNASVDALVFMFKPDFSKISIDVVVYAVAQAFFSIGLGTATMMTFGSYLPKDINIVRSSIIIGLSDTCVALIAGLAIFPIVFSFGLDPAGGAGLFFKTLPVALSSLAGGHIIGTAFFVLALFAALTTAIALFEVVTAYLLDQFSLRRKHAVLLVGIAAWLLSFGSVYSSQFMDLLDVKITGAVMVPLCGLLSVLFVGHQLKSTIVQQQLSGVSDTTLRCLLFLVRYFAPVAVTAVLVAQLIQAFF